MTISTSSSQTTLGGNGATTAFNFSFIADSPSAIKVTYTDAAGNQTVLTSGYTLIINPPAAGQIWGIGGTVTYPLVGSPIANGTSITIERVLPLTQDTTISNQGDFYPQVVEAALDTLCMEIQQVDAAVLHSIQFPSVDPSTITSVLPAAAARANQYLFFDASGNAGTSPSAGNGVPISTAMTPVVGASTLALSRTAYGLGAAATENLGSNVVDDGLGNLSCTSTLITGSQNTSNNTIANGTSVQRSQIGGLINYFRNGTMDIWQRGIGPITVTTAGAYTADGWIVVPTGASVTAQRVNNAGGATSYALRVNGAASVTDITVKQRIEGIIAARMYPNGSAQVTIQAKAIQNTSGTITPTLTVKHATAIDNWGSSVIDINAVALQPCVTGILTQLSYTFTTVLGTANGLEIGFDFGNHFTSGANHVDITELDVRVTPGVVTGLSTPTIPELRPVYAELVYCQRYYWRQTAGSAFASFGNCLAASTTSIRGIIINNPIPMWTAPSILETGGVIGVFDGVTITNTTAISISTTNTMLNELNATVASGLTQFRPYIMLANNDSTAYIGLSAEL